MLVFPWLTRPAVAEKNIEKWLIIKIFDIYLFIFQTKRQYIKTFNQRRPKQEQSYTYLAYNKNLTKKENKNLIKAYETLKKKKKKNYALNCL